MYTILIADDEEIECKTLERMIAYRFETIDILPSVGDGISLMRSMEARSPDIVVVDINMPGLSGLEAVELMRERHSQAQVIINTAYSDFAFAQRALKCGACDYVLKPCNKEAILRAIDGCCRRLDARRTLESGRQAQVRQQDAWNAVLGREIMNALIIGDVDEHSFALLRRENPTLAPGGAVLVVMPQDTQQRPLAEGMPLREKITRTLRPLCFCLEREYRGMLFLLVMLPADGQDGMGRLRDIAGILSGQSGLQGAFTVGVSLWKQKDEQLPEALWECRAACRNTAGTLCFYARTEAARVMADAVNKIDLSALTLDTSKAEKNAHVHKAMAYIRRNYMRDISLDDVAGECGLSPFYITRILKQTLDVSFVTLLTSVRMERALKLLREGRMSNREIAEAVGYSSASYFHKVFRRKTGIGLNDYRLAIGVNVEDEEETP